VGNKIVCDLVAQRQQRGGGSGDGQADDNFNSSDTPSFSRTTVEISTGEALCFGIHAFRPHDDTLQMIRLVACIGDEIFLYGIPITNHEGAPNNSNISILLAKANVGSGYGANVATYTAMFNAQHNQLQHLIGVGCENGHLVVFEIQTNQTESSSSSDSPNNNNNNSMMLKLTKVIECKGHTKAICAIQFHPRGHELLSSAKDGTARIFSVATGNELATMKCEVHDPNGPPPAAVPKNDPSKSTIKTKDPRMMKRAPQILVRGCAYGDLEGKMIYTIASGKRGAAYLTKWKSSSSGGGGGGGGGMNSQQQQQRHIRPEYRVQCSPVPISATSLSSDCTIFALGSVEGSILLYNLETKSVVKQFKEVHDLPVTCMASRPIPSALMLPGELEGGVNFDAVSASADNRMGRWTLQRKSRIKPARAAKGTSSSYSRRKGPVEQLVWNVVRLPLLFLVGLTMVAVRDVTIVCREEFGMPAVLMDAGAAGHCLYREVLWAEDTRPGIKFVPV